MEVQELLDIIRRMTDLYDQMIELSGKKKEAIIQNDMKKLNQIIAEETGLIKQMEALDQQRGSEVNRFLVFEGYDSDNAVTLSEVVRMVSNTEQKKMLYDAQARLKQSIAALEKSNAVNQILLEQAIQYIDHTINLLVGSAEEDAIYRIPSKNGAAASRAGFFDLRT